MNEKQWHLNIWRMLSQLYDNFSPCLWKNMAEKVLSDAHNEKHIQEYKYLENVQKNL